MLSIDDIDLYIRMNGVFIDESLNAFTITNTGSVGFTTNSKGISGMAGDFNATTKQLTLEASAGNKLAESMNLGCSIIFGAYITSLSTTRVPFIQWGGSDPNKSFYNYIGTNGNMRSGRFGGGDINPTPSNAIVINTWHRQKRDFEAVNYVGLKDNLANSSGSFSGNAVENATGNLKIGGDVDQTITLSGRMENFIAFNRKISELEEQFINKFGNLKRCA